MPGMSGAAIPLMIKSKNPATAFQNCTMFGAQGVLLTTQYVGINGVPRVPRMSYPIRRILIEIMTKAPQVGRGKRNLPGLMSLLSLTAISVMCVGCEKASSLVAYPTNSGYLESAPVILVAQLVKDDAVGQSHPSRWSPDQPMQLYRITVHVENVLRGNVQSGLIRIYYLIDIRASEGPPRMGMMGHGGNWRVGDRITFFLRWDSGVLRTWFDTFAVGTIPVLTGPHPNYTPRLGESVEDSVVDILLDRGRGCDNTQWAHAILVSTSKAYNFDLAYTVRKLRQIAASYVTEVRRAAEIELDRP